MDVLLLSQYLVAGLMLGVTYVLIGLGVTFIFSIVRMINWSMGQFYMLGSFIQYLLVVGLLGPHLWFLAIPIVAVSVFLIGLVVHPLLIRPMYSRSMSRPGEYATLVTIALALLLQGAATILNGPYQRTPGSVLPDVMIGPLPTSGAKFAASAGAVLVVIAFYVFIKRSWLGLAMRATAQNRVAVQTAGANIERLDQVAFGLGVSLAALAGALLAPVFLVYPENGAMSTVKGFEIVIIGGLGSIPGAVVAGLLLGIVEGLGAVFIEARYQNIYGFVLLMAILVLRPTGLLGERGRVD